MVAATAQESGTRQQFQAHFDEWVKESGICEAIARLNLKSIDDPVEIASLLNWHSYLGTAGWYVTSCDPLTGKRGSFGQFKPNSPIQFPDKDKPQKYFTFPKDTESQAICLLLALNDWVKISSRVGVPIANEDIDESRDDLGFWQWVLNHPEIPILITEGAKKAACLLSHGWVAIALTGVWNGQKNKKLHPSIVPFVVPGRPIDLVFDADVVVKESVADALRVLGNLLHRAKAIVRIVLWDLELGKGCDDFIVANGPEEFSDVMDNAKPYSEWLLGLEQQFKPTGSTGSASGGKTRLVLPADTLGASIAEEYQDKLAFNNESRVWMRYEADYSGVWSAETDEYIESIVSAILDAKGIVGYGSHSYVVNVLKKMRSRLTVRKWLTRSPKELLPFQNGVLEVATGKLLPHSPGYRFTWSLPRIHNPLATNWEPISRFLDEATGGSERMKKILLCWLNAVLKGRSDLQVFLHLTGPGGSGKGTFTRLCIALVGERNNYNSSLLEWNTNRFESANAYRKRLVSFPDEDKYSGGLGRFKWLTGGDYIRGEEKGKKAFQYIYDGMVMVASNFPIFAGDTSSGMARRILMLPFNHQIPKSQRRNLDKEFASYLDALTNYVLAIPDEEVTSTLLGLAEEAPEIIEQVWEYRMRIDSIAAWINECCIYDPNALEPVGNDKDNAEALFGSYWQYCQRTGSKAKGSREFSPSLLDLCKHILKWASVEKIVRNNGKFIKGLRLREDADSHIPNPIEALSAPSVTDATRHGDECSDEPKLALDKSSGGSDGSNQLLDKINPSQEILNLEISPNNTEDVHQDSSLPLQSNPGQGFSRKADPKVTDGPPVTDGDRVEADSSPQPSLKNETVVTPIAVGDRVEIVLTYSQYQGQTGIVRRVFQDQGLTLYTVQLSGGKRIDYQLADLKLVT